MAKQSDVKSITKSWESGMNDFFVKKLPALPEKAKEILVKFGPWITLIALVLSIPTLLAALGLWSMFAPAVYEYGYHYGYDMAWWISIASMGLMAWALPGLFKRKLTAWRLMFYSSLVMGLYYLVSFNLGGLVIGLGLSLYILFQIKSYYK